MSHQTSQQIPIDINIFKVKELQSAILNRPSYPSNLSKFCLSSKILKAFNDHFTQQLESIYVIQNKTNQHIHLETEISLKWVKVWAKGSLSKHEFIFHCHNQSITINGKLTNYTNRMTFVTYLCTLLADLKTGNAKMIGKRKPLFSVRRGSHEKII